MSIDQPDSILNMNFQNPIKPFNKIIFSWRYSGSLWFVIPRNGDSGKPRLYGFTRIFWKIKSFAQFFYSEEKLRDAQKLIFFWKFSKEGHFQFKKNILQIVGILNGPCGWGERGRCNPKKILADANFSSNIIS